MSEEIKSQIETGFTSLKSQLDAKLAEHTAQMQKYGEADTKLTGDIDALSSEFKSLRDEITDLAQKQSGFTAEAEVKTAGAEFIKSSAYASFVSGERDKVRLDVKNTVIANNTTTQPMQIAGVTAGSFAPRTIRGQIPTIVVNQNSVNSLRELDWTNAAAETAQTTLKPESALTFEPYNVPVETIAHFIKVSNQLLADAPAVSAYIDTRLRDGLAQRVERQLLLGTGTTPQIKGLTIAGNFVAFTATTGANLVESINKAKYNRWAVGEVVDTVIVNPADWAAMEVLREGAGTGAYLYGNPGTVAGSSPFGVDVVMSQYMPAGKFLIGSLRSSATIYQRQGATVEMGYIDDDFTRNMVTIRAEERLGLAVDRPMGLMFGDITA